MLHALARAEDVSPSGVHGIRALDQISAPIARDVPTDHGAGETLAARNKKLLDSIAEMEASADRRRLAYLVGVTCSAIVAVLAPGALAALCITLIAPSSFSELLIPALIACVLLFVVIVTQFQRLGCPLANDGAAGRAIRALRSSSGRRPAAERCRRRSGRRRPGARRGCFRCLPAEVCARAPNEMSALPSVMTRWEPCLICCPSPPISPPPKVISSGAVILRDEHGMLVIEKPNYRDHWLLRAVPWTPVRTPSVRPARGTRNWGWTSRWGEC